jgi:hypothetical protein
MIDERREDSADGKNPALSARQIRIPRSLSAAKCHFIQAMMRL